MKNMKKLLNTFTTLSLSTIASISTVACGCTNNKPDSNPVYNNVEDVIKNLNLNSYAKPGVAESIDNIILSIQRDVFNVLMIAKYTKGVIIDPHKLYNNLYLDPNEVINEATTKPLAYSDLTKNGKLNLSINVYYNGKKIKLKSAFLNVTTKTNQQIVDYINSFDFNKVFQSPNNSEISVGQPISYFEEEVKNKMYKSLGSFSSAFIDESKLNLTNFDKDGSSLVQSDLNSFQNMNLTIIYNYDTIQNQKINITVTIVKIDISNLALDYIYPLKITLTDQSNNDLSEKAVKEIIDSIKSNIQTELELVQQIPVTSIDYDITGIETTVFKEADFKDDKTVAFTITAKEESKTIIGTLKDQTINIRVINKL